MPKSQNRTSMLYDSLIMSTTAPLFTDDKEVWNYIADAMVERRGELGLTQTQASRSAGLGLTTWSQLEQSLKDNLQVRTATKLCRFLGWKPTAIHDLILNGIEPTEQSNNDSFSITWNEYESLVQMVQEQNSRITALEKRFDNLGKMFR